MLFVVVLSLLSCKLQSWLFSRNSHIRQPCSCHSYFLTLLLLLVGFNQPTTIIITVIIITISKQQQRQATTIITVMISQSTSSLEPSPWKSVLGRDQAAVGLLICCLFLFVCLFVCLFVFVYLFVCFFVFVVGGFLRVCLCVGGLLMVCLIIEIKNKSNNKGNTTITKTIMIIRMTIEQWP